MSLHVCGHFSHYSGIERAYLWLAANPVSTRTCMYLRASLLARVRASLLQPLARPIRHN